jgi:gpW
MPLPTLQQRIDDAELALHRLQIGQAAVKVRISDGSETEFKAAEINELRGYLGDLLAQRDGIHRPKHGAIGVIF